MSTETKATPIGADIIPINQPFYIADCYGVAHRIEGQAKEAKKRLLATAFRGRDLESKDTFRVTGFHAGLTVYHTAQDNVGQYTTEAVNRLIEAQSSQWRVANRKPPGPGYWQGRVVGTKFNPNSLPSDYPVLDGQQDVLRRIQLYTARIEQLVSVL
jgi:hypothetical protein